MTDWPLVAVRFALYLDLGLALGWPAFCLYALRGNERRPGGHLPTALPLIFFGVVGLVLSALGIWFMAAAMAGTAIGEIEPSLLDAVLYETAVGTAFLVRAAALLLVAVAGMLTLRFPVAGLTLAAGAGAAALASLAWNGHAAATEGVLAWVHLGSDFLHLWAAGLWLGALFALLALVSRAGNDATRLTVAHRALEGFARIGTAAVLTLLVTGIINEAILLGTLHPAVVAATTHGQLLLLKLALFVVMLVLAATNRFRLIPTLRRVLTDAASPKRSVTSLRRSLGAETAAAVVILALVGWLGLLQPLANP